jgi:hypothetical protein
MSLTHLEDVQAVKEAIKYMRNLIEEQLDCYAKMKAASAKNTPMWNGEIRTSFDEKVDEYTKRTIKIKGDADVLFEWAQKYIQLAEERDEFMRR